MNRFLMVTLILITALTGGCDQKPMLEKVAAGLDFPEGPAWNGSGKIYVSNCYADWVAVLSEGRMDTFVVRPTEPFDFGKTNGLAFGPDGFLYGCDYGSGTIVRFAETGTCEVVLEGYQGHRFNRPNDLAFDPSGNLYFTDPHLYDPENRDGVVYKYSLSTGEIRPVYEDLAFPNGIAFSGDGKSLYVCESALNRVLKFPVDDQGNMGRYTVFSEMPGGDPDGLAIDQKNNVYVAHFGGGLVYKFTPGGMIADTIRVPGKKPTNVEFAGADLRTLYITEVETNAVYRIRVDIPGLKLFGLP
jgi:gluconolactonase